MVRSGSMPGWRIARLGARVGRTRTDHCAPAETDCGRPGRSCHRPHRQLGLAPVVRGPGFGPTMPRAACRGTARVAAVTRGHLTVTEHGAGSRVTVRVTIPQAPPDADEEIARGLTETLDRIGRIARA